MVNFYPVCIDHSVSNRHRIFLIFDESYVRVPLRGHNCLQHEENNQGRSRLETVKTEEKVDPRGSKLASLGKSEGILILFRPVS